MKMHCDLAPIALSTYSRLGHLKQAVEALQKNELAKESELYVFSDAPKPGDEEKVQAVRNYIKTIDGFKKVHIYERKENNRVANNRGGMRMLLDKYERVIFIEEDVITSPFFLNYMNDALRVYKNDNRVLAITGYGPPIEYPDDYEYEVALGKRAFFWSFAIWKKDFDTINMDITMKDYWQIRLNPFLSHRYKKAGEDVMPQLRNVASGLVEALDIRADYTMFKLGKFILYPRFSMIQNNGLDGSGEHWTTSTDKFDVDLGDSKVFVHSAVEPYEIISIRFSRLYIMGVDQKISGWREDILLLLVGGDMSRMKLLKSKLKLILAEFGLQR